MRFATAEIDSNEFHLLRDYIEQNCGIFLLEEKMYLVCTRLTSLMVESGCNSFAELYHKALSDVSFRLRDKIVEAITTNETFWFRDESPFVILGEELFKNFAAEIGSGRRSKIKIWCAGCSTGQEPYSIAMTVLEFIRKQQILKPEHVEILGTDISSAVLYIAMAGRYDGLAMSRGLPEELKNRYFDPDGKVWVIKNDVKKMVRFQKLNLQDDFYHLENQDIVFCRNVLIYFSNEFKKDILKRISRVLGPGGNLFLGASESLFNLTQDYRMFRHTMGFYYAKELK
ncbi:MAG: protein-glutamate O-methyltransferase CheR [Desulfobacterales bacterium]|nr:protein-glutamate O-methyltransferase CheR [Desulfobacterales bacterium]